MIMIIQGFKSKDPKARIQKDTWSSHLLGADNDNDNDDSKQGFKSKDSKGCTWSSQLLGADNDNAMIMIMMTQKQGFKSNSKMEGRHTAICS